MTRSEERRVGKECRYRRDWSSDVCSSDLIQLASSQTSSAFPVLRILYPYNKPHLSLSMVNSNDLMVQGLLMHPANLVYKLQEAHHYYTCRLIALLSQYQRRNNHSLNF